MKLYEIQKTLNTISPFELQESWDNSNLLVGNKNQEISKIVLSIDVDDALVESMQEGSLLITHHPIIFKGLKSLETSSYPMNLLHKMMQKNIANIAMHTNFDKTHLNKYVVEKVLGYEIVQSEDFVLYFDIDESFDSFVQKVKQKFSLPHTKVVKTTQNIKRVALTTGSGASLLKTIKADCFLTGDIKYHDAMEAKSMKISLIDIGHYESERFFGEILQHHLKNLGLEVIISSSENPFTYI